MAEVENNLINEEEISNLIDAAVSGGMGGVSGGDGVSGVSGVSGGDGDDGGGVVEEVEVDLTDKVSKYKDAILDVETGGLWSKYRGVLEDGDEDEMVEIYKRVTGKDIDLDEYDGKEREKALKRVKREVEGYFDNISGRVMGEFRVKVGGSSGGSAEEFRKKVDEVINLIDSGELSVGGYKLSGIRQVVGDGTSGVISDENEMIARLAIISNENAFKHFIKVIANDIGMRIAREMSKRYAGAGVGVMNPGVSGVVAGGSNKVLEALAARAQQHLIKE